jgi:NADH-ubiquinone oxidoreductase chain 6
LGGLIVLFIYVVSLASNEKFELNFEELSFLAISAILILIIINFSSFFNKLMDFNSFNLNDQTILIFSNENIILTILIIVYLLFTLIVAVKISSKYEGPLRNFI